MLSNMGPDIAIVDRSFKPNSLLIRPKLNVHSIQAEFWTHIQYSS